ncbi:DUF2059 domain-containing protein [Paraglaciecola sp.]|uniref:DUF2059 domain-containing protein n=1 Tax=Paraglaciecola sp. TaxID=1920173 RepID=UPI003EF22E69
MKKVLLVPLMFFTLSAPTLANESPIDKLFKVMSMEKQMEGGFEAMLPMIEQMTAKLKLDGAAKEELKGIFRAWFTEDLDRSKITNEIKKHYSESFSDEEITEITKFYQTPVGQKFLEKSTQLMKLGAQIGMQEAQAKQAQLMQRLSPFMMKHGVNKP